MKNEMLTRSQADGRIRGAARVASCFCWVAALVALLSALFGAWSTVVLTTASMEETGHDAVTAFFSTSKGSPGFTVSETGYLRRGRQRGRPLAGHGQYGLSRR